MAVLTNGSLLWIEDVQNDLMKADIVLPSLDVGDEFFFPIYQSSVRRYFFQSDGGRHS